MCDQGTRSNMTLGMIVVTFNLGSTWRSKTLLALGMGETLVVFGGWLGSLYRGL